MNTEPHYPLLIPPSDLATKDRREWSPKEAKAYLDWLVSQMPQRVTFFLKFIGCAEVSLTTENLAVIDAAFRRAISAPQFTEPGSSPKRLSAAGYAIAADWGLMLATFVLDDTALGATWDVFRKPKSDASYNLPVLLLPTTFPVDPVAIGVAYATPILRGQEPRFCTVSAYETWTMKPGKPA
jgi:hypothetical protein